MRISDWSSDVCSSDLTSHAQFGVMLLDPYQFAPQLVVKGNDPHAEDQFMQALAMLGVDAQTGIDILIDEDVIEDSDVRQAAVPCVILEDRSGWSAATVHKHTSRVQIGSANTSTPVTNE